MKPGHVGRPRPAPVGTNSTTPTDDHVRPMKPGKRALALWAAFPELFPTTIPGAVHVPYPKRRIRPRVD